MGIVVAAEEGEAEVEATTSIVVVGLDTLVHTKPRMAKGKTSSTSRTTTEEGAEEDEAAVTTHSSGTTTKRIAKDSKRSVSRTSRATTVRSEDVAGVTVVSSEAVAEGVASTTNNTPRGNRMSLRLLRRTPTSRSEPGVNSSPTSET